MLCLTVSCGSESQSVSFLFPCCRLPSGHVVGLGPEVAAKKAKAKAKGKSAASSSAARTRKTVTKFPFTHYTGAQAACIACPCHFEPWEIVWSVPIPYCTTAALPSGVLVHGVASSLRPDLPRQRCAGEHGQDYQGGSPRLCAWLGRGSGDPRVGFLAFLHGLTHCAEDVTCLLRWAVQLNEEVP